LLSLYLPTLLFLLFIGSKNTKGGILHTYKEQIMGYLQLNLSISSIVKIINNQLAQILTYCFFTCFIDHDNDLSKVLLLHREKQLICSDLANA